MDSIYSQDYIQDTAIFEIGLSIIMYLYMTL